MPLTGWKKIKAGSYVSDCGRFRIERRGRSWAVSVGANYLGVADTLAAAKLVAAWSPDRAASLSSRLQAKVAECLDVLGSCTARTAATH